MKTIRTTVTLPADVHQQLRTQAFRYNKSLNDVIMSKLQEAPERKCEAKSKEEEIDADISFFKQMAKKGDQIDLVKALREERDRR